MREAGYFEEYRDHDIIRFRDDNSKYPYTVFPSGAQNATSHHKSLKSARKRIDKEAGSPPFTENQILLMDIDASELGKQFVRAQTMARDARDSNLRWYATRGGSNT
jgi:hypothetical protein